MRFEQVQCQSQAQRQRRGGEPEPDGQPETIISTVSAEADAVLEHIDEALGEGVLGGERHGGRGIHQHQHREQRPPGV